MRFLLASAFGALIADVCVTATPPAGDMPEVAVADWIRIAYYEAMPRSTADNALAAIRKQCASPGDSDQLRIKKADSRWLCNGTELKVFRAVHVTGSTGKEGYICGARSAPGGIRYYPPDLFGADSGCRAFWYEGSMVVHLEDLRNPSDAAVGSSLPQGRWNLRVCMTVGYTNKHPCAYLDQRLILRVENPVGVDKHGPVVFKKTISEELAQKMFTNALAAVRAIDSTPGHYVLDGTLFKISITANGNDVEATFTDSDVAHMSPDVRELNQLLHETAPVAF